MRKNKKKWLLGFLCVALAFTAVGCTPDNGGGNGGGGNETPQGTSVHFINVSNLRSAYGATGYYGTSLCVLIQHDGVNILIDAGVQATVPRPDMGAGATQVGSPELVEEYLQEQGVEKIDYMVLTHAHNDHAGGMAHQIESFDVGKVYLKPIDWSMGNYDSTRVFYDEVYLAATYKVNSDNTYPEIIIPDEEGYTVTVDEETDFEIWNCKTLYEEQEVNDDYNSFSFMVKFTYKNVSALIGGDAIGADTGGPYAASDKVVLGNLGVCQLYSLQHHGTGYPYTSNELLAEIQPKYCVVNGITEAYAAETDERLKAAGATVYITGELGDIVFDCDGENFTYRNEINEEL